MLEGQTLCDEIQLHVCVTSYQTVRWDPQLVQVFGVEFRRVNFTFAMQLSHTVPSGYTKTLYTYINRIYCYTTFFLISNQTIYVLVHVK